MITLGNKQLCEYCLTENCGKPCRFCGFDKASFKAEVGALPPGCILSEKYIVGKIIGKGGFGITYLAYDIKHEKQVALKEYYPISYAVRSQNGVTVTASRSEDADIYKKGMKKFYEEASLVSKFNGNPNIVSVYEFFYENDTAYFVMELLEGVSLKSYINEHGTLSHEEILYIADEISNALMVAHKENTLHRDVSPDNIMLCEDGKVKLIDFGAARQVASDDPKSMSVILKQGFAPLEQYQRRGKQGPWTDIYSLGATLYYAATKIRLDDPMSRLDDDSEFQANSHGIEPQMWEVLKHALNIKVNDRYKSAVEFREALSKLPYKPVPIKPVPIKPELPVTDAQPPVPIDEPVPQAEDKKPLNKKLIAILSSAVGVILVGGIALIAVTLGRSGSSPNVSSGTNDPQSSSVSVPAFEETRSTSTWIELPPIESYTSSSSSSTSTPATPVQTYSPGEWDGNTFTSEFLGIRIQLDSDWEPYSNAQIAEMNGIADMSFASARDILADGMYYMNAKGPGLLDSMEIFVSDTASDVLDKDQLKQTYVEAGFECETSLSNIEFLGETVKSIEAKISNGNLTLYETRVYIPAFSKASGKYYAVVSVTSMTDRGQYAFLSKIEPL